MFAVTVPFVTDEMVFPSNEDVRANYFKILGQKKKIIFFPSLYIWTIFLKAFNIYIILNDNVRAIQCLIQRQYYPSH